MEDYRVGRSGCARKTIVGGATWSGGGPGVCGSGACRSRPGPSKPREEHQPRAHAFTSRTRTGETKDRGWRRRRISLLIIAQAGRDVTCRGYAVGWDSDELLRLITNTSLIMIQT